MVAARQFALLTVACAACTGTTLDVGTNDAGPTRRAAEAGPDAAPGGSGLEALLGTWTGYIESYSFSSGSDGVVLAFTQDASGEVEGAVTLGQGEPPPPATDGNIGYPPALEDAGLFASDLLANGGLYEGFPYTVVAMSFDGIRLTAGVALTELWKSWCPLQTSYGDEADGGGAPYACLPNWGFMSGPAGCSQKNPSTGQTATVDCGKLELCRPLQPISPCTCGVAACLPNMTPNMTFDMQLTGDRLDGSTVLPGSQAHNIHLTRSP